MRTKDTESALLEPDTAAWMKVALEQIIDAVLAANPAAITDYRLHKAQAAGFLVGQVMKATDGQANPALVQKLLRERLKYS